MIERWCLDEFRLGTSWSDVTPPSGEAGRLDTPFYLGAGRYQLSYLGAPGAKYALDWTSSLLTPLAWTPQVTNTAPFNGWVLFTNHQTGSASFWRTRSVL